jgi:hypothetical protein
MSELKHTPGGIPVELLWKEIIAKAEGRTP